MFIAEVADVNAEDSGSQGPLQNASYWDDVEVIRTILPKVSDINDLDRHGRTALHEAARAGHRELVETLLAHEANPNVLDFHEPTPLFFACLTDPGGRSGNLRATIKLLIETLHQKCYPFLEINIATKRQRTPLRQAASCGCFQGGTRGCALRLRGRGPTMATSVASMTEMGKPLVNKAAVQIGQHGRVRRRS